MCIVGDFILLPESVLFYLLMVGAEGYCRTGSYTYPMTHTHTHTHSMNSLNEVSAHPRDLYLTRHNFKKRWTSMPPAELEPTSEKPQTHALDRAATVIDCR